MRQRDPPPFPDTPAATLARYIRSQVALATVKPAGCVQLNNAEALQCAEALEAADTTPCVCTAQNPAVDKPG